MADIKVRTIVDIYLRLDDSERVDLARAIEDWDVYVTLPPIIQQLREALDA